MAVKSPDSYTFTVGKLDAGMAILLGERAHLIEFPSLLLPPGATAGSIVNISVTQNFDEEKKRENDFWDLQGSILEAFGSKSPQAPEITLRNVTQTSVTLEWPPLDLATATLRSLDIYRNGQRLASIPSPLQNTSTKLSGLDLATEYTFRLVMRTSAGNFPSNLIRVRTHTMTDTSGISVCFGNVQDSVLLENAKLALNEMRAKWSEKIQIDTTHFVCTTPAASPSAVQTSPTGLHSAPGVEYQRALQLSIPVVQPQWILACRSERKMMPISGFYLGVTPATPITSPPFSRPQSMSQTSLPHSARAANRASLPAPPRTPTSPPPRPSQSGARTAPPKFEPTPEEPGESVEDAEGGALSPSKGKPQTPHMRHGTMDRAFKFPPPKSPSPVEEEKKTDEPPAASPAEPRVDEDGSEEAGLSAVGSEAAPALSLEVPPPPTPIEKEKVASPQDGDEEVGETEEISLN
ncbi:fibronectin type III/BRCA1 domain-containing protein [Amylostereum chailletii]|nr:fibronectin type III/BRCA1 domain-containing protein [Amylostereum chailletii]